jgi:hypothetical protein
MSVEQFDTITLKELYLKIEGFREDRQDLEENRLVWLRWQTAQLLNIHIDKKHKIKPTDLFTLPYEKKKKKHSVIPGKKRRKEIITLKKKWKNFKETPATLDDIKLIMSKKN